MLEFLFASYFAECPCFEEHSICDEQTDTCTCNAGFFGKCNQGKLTLITKSQYKKILATWPKNSKSFHLVYLNLLADWTKIWTKDIGQVSWRQNLKKKYIFVYD